MKQTHPRNPATNSKAETISGLSQGFAGSDKQNTKQGVSGFDRRLVLLWEIRKCKMVSFQQRLPLEHIKGRRKEDNLSGGRKGVKGAPWLPSRGGLRQVSPRRTGCQAAPLQRDCCVARRSCKRSPEAPSLSLWNYFIRKHKESRGELARCLLRRSVEARWMDGNYERALCRVHVQRDQLSKLWWCLSQYDAYCSFQHSSIHSVLFFFNWIPCIRQISIHPDTNWMSRSVMQGLNMIVLCRTI